MSLILFGSPGRIRTIDQPVNSPSRRFSQSGYFSAQAVEIAKYYRSLLFQIEGYKQEPCGNLAAHFPRLSIATRKVFRKVFSAGLLILLTTTAAAAVECRTSGKTWRTVDGKRCWHNGPRRVSKAALHWAPPAPPPVKRPDPRLPAPAPAPIQIPDVMLAFDTLREADRVRLARVGVPQLGENSPNQGKSPAGETQPAVNIPTRQAGMTGGAMAGLMVATGVLIVSAFYMLALGLVLERARPGSSRKGFAARWRSLTTPPAMLQEGPGPHA